jgi:hypothetical protein
MRLPTGKHALSGQIPAGAKKIVINCPHKSLVVKTLFWSGNGYPSKVAGDGVPMFDYEGADSNKRVDRLRPWREDIPEGATNFAIYYEYKRPDRRYVYEGSLDFI